MNLANIKTLHRKKNTENGSNRMDELTYKYENNNVSNRLDQVIDAVTAPTNADDIKTQPVNNYRYNEIGQLIRNEGEKVDYQYNASGLVTLVKYNGKNKVRFYYNDKGFRTKKITYNEQEDEEKTTYYVRDASGSVLAIYENTILKELPIYGVSRLGIYNKTTNTSVYQLTDHLGNVRAVIAKNGSNAVALTSATDYYPFGMPMPNRVFGANGYRYAYQGQEKDPETGKEAFQLRLWDGRIGRWLTVDPAHAHPSLYLGMGNNPANTIDPDGGCPCSECPENCDGFEMTHPGVDLGTIGKGVSNSSGYTPSFRDWQILESLRQHNSFIYSSIKNRYDLGDFFKLGGHNWGNFNEGFAAGWKNWDPNGLGNQLMNFTAVAIGVPLVAANPVTPAIIGDLTINSGRNMFINSTSNFLGQVTTNGFSLEKVDYFDVVVSGLFSGSGSVLLQSTINIRGDGNYGLNENFMKDYLTKSVIFGVHRYGGYLQGLSGNPATEVLGDLTFRTIVTHGALGVSSVLNSSY